MLGDDVVQRVAPARIVTLTVWAARVSWLATAAVGHRAVGAALADHDVASARALTLAAWVGFAIGALALAVKATATLTVARVVVPGALALAVASALGGADTVAVLSLAAPALLASVLTMSGDVGHAWVQASAYGDERRVPLRPPIGFLVAAVVAWLGWAAVVLVAAVGLAAGRWTWALPVAVIAAVLTWWAGRRWHLLARRWLVSVPAGLVVHDPVVLGETLMLTRRQIAGITLATLPVRGDDAPADLTGPTIGTGLAVTLSETVTAVFAPRPGLPQGRAIHVRSFVVAPSRPGAVVTEARRRRLPVR